MNLWQSHDGESAINLDNGRAVKAAFFGVALYEGSILDGVYHGTHQGSIDGGEAKVNQWLSGGRPDGIITIYRGDPASTERDHGPVPNPTDQG